jgi:hypothetical protein
MRWAYFGTRLALKFFFGGINWIKSHSFQPVTLQSQKSYCSTKGWLLTGCVHLCAIQPGGCARRGHQVASLPCLNGWGVPCLGWFADRKCSLQNSSNISLLLATDSAAMKAGLQRMKRSFAVIMLKLSPFVFTRINVTAFCDSDL